LKNKKLLEIKNVEEEKMRTKEYKGQIEEIIKNYYLEKMTSEERAILFNGETNISKQTNKLFEYFCLEQFFKRERMLLTRDELLASMPSGANDWGIDGFVLFGNGTYIDDISDLPKTGDIRLELFLFQVKNTTSYSEAVIEKFQSFITLISGDDFDRKLDVTKKEPEQEYSMNAELYNMASSFIAILDIIGIRLQSLSIKYIYACMGSSRPENAGYWEKVKQLSTKTCDFYRNFTKNEEQNFVLFDQGDIIPLIRSLDNDIDTHQLIFRESFEDNSLDKGMAYVGHVLLRDYYTFLVSTDKDNDRLLRESLFEMNVRDYKNMNEVNKEIYRELEKIKETDDYLEFWWLNNGATIIAEKVVYNAKKMSLQNPKIVNGLQTSLTLNKYVNEYGEDVLANDKRSILVKVIQTKNEAHALSIIQATNSQTQVKRYLLRAHDDLQVMIDNSARLHGFFYERRDNYYKNQKVQKDLIITTPQLAQFITATILHDPTGAKRSSAGLVSTDTKFDVVFNNKVEVTTYINAIKSHQKVAEYISKLSREQELSEWIKKYYKFHVLYVLLGLINNTHIYHQISDDHIEKITEENIQQAINFVVSQMKTYKEKEDMEKNYISLSKKPDFSGYLTDQLRKFLQKEKA